MSEPATKEGGESQKCQLCANVRKSLVNFFKPRRPTADNLLFWYAPVVGGVSYSAFSIHIFKPEVLERGKYAAANCLLFNAHLGCGLYLYHSRHLSATTQYYRIMYSVYGALLFNFGSILLWAVTKSILPEDSIVRTVFSLSSSICMLTIGREYVGYVDGWCSKQK